MRAIMPLVGLAVMTLAGCAPMPPPAPSPPSGSPAAAETANATAGPVAAAPTTATTDPQEPEMKALPPVDVRAMPCAMLNSASDDDKAYAATFLLGYRSAMVHAHIIDTKQIDAILQAAVTDCAANPAANAYRVFAAAQIKAAAGERPPHRMRHRPLAPTPAAATPEPQRGPTET